MSVDEGHRHAQGDDDRDVLTSALAAVASSRRSPGSSGKKARQPLPREFRDRRSPEEKPHGEPSTPHRNRNGYGRSSPSSPRTSRTNFQNETQVSPRRPGQSRYSTVRELTRKHQTRWLSEDLSGPAEGDEEPSHHASGSGEVVGRRQGHRGGSSDTLLAGNGGRSLIGEGLRAAGLTKRRDPGDDLFGAELTAPGSPRRTKSTGNSSVVQEPSIPALRFDPHTPVNNWLRRDERTTRSGGMAARPGTSMAALHHDTQEIPPPRTAPPGLRAYKSTYTLNREPVMSPHAQQEFPDRAYSSPFASVRAASVAPAAIASPNTNKDMSAEHRRLMMEALTMFESQLSRIPPMGQTTTNTIPGLFQNAQHLVHSLDKLNGMLKSGTNRALEAQIDAEVADVSTGIDLVELWRDVGADHRESLRMSDEVVRNMTGFLLGVGKVLREATSSKDPQQHLRTVSLDESVGTRLTPDSGATPSGGRSSDGRKSRETRRSWDPREMREASLARLSSLERSHVRPASALLRGSATSSSEGRSVAEAVDGTPQTVKVSTMAPSSSMRRLYLPREQRATPDIAPIQTNLNFKRRDSPDKFEPSPTPTSRTSQSAQSERQRNFPAASVPPSLSTLPSESLLTRTVSTSSSENSSSHRKVSGNSTLTVRAELSAFNSILKPSGATTSLTPATVSAERSPGEPPASAYYRSNIDRGQLPGSARAGPSGNVVTLSRATLATARLRSASNASSAVDEEPPVRLEAAPVLSPMSGSETERPESWRRTIAARPRASLESAWEREREERTAGRTATVAARKERRRTITEIFQR
ncbi:hypothetical protein DAEQUDRAFT_761889 [Daedalea quercina L-15889]|uniref:Uncharacterized protein n=1 Tax=Daedalea quercina L-15889 TaxID=1314783 RepID=A0A165TTY7_9APHY|nr:hypothetical protein DAEQUDRAFT_761889 [Daedalea quercina L-15889]